MSGIYIKDMEMPTRQVLAVINPDGLVEILNSDNILIEEFQAIQVPPHGRLGDLDKLAEKIEGIWDCNDLYFQPNDQICDPEDCKGCKWRETWDCFRRMVNHAHTVIPAEEGE